MTSFFRFFFTHFFENLTLIFDLDLQSRSSALRSLNAPFGLYLGTKYEVCRWNILRDMTNSLVFYPFDLDQWPSDHQHLDHWMRLISMYQIWSMYCRWKNIPDMASFFLNWLLTLTFDQGHHHLGHWLRLTWLYLGTKYEVCGSNRFWDMNLGGVDFLFDLEIWPLTLSQGHRKIY